MYLHVQVVAVVGWSPPTSGPWGQRARLLPSVRRTHVRTVWWVCVCRLKHPNFHLYMYCDSVSYEAVRIWSITELYLGWCHFYFLWVTVFWTKQQTSKRSPKQINIFKHLLKKTWEQNYVTMLLTVYNFSVYFFTKISTAKGWNVEWEKRNISSHKWHLLVCYLTKASETVSRHSEASSNISHNRVDQGSLNATQTRAEDEANQTYNS